MYPKNGTQVKSCRLELYYKVTLEPPDGEDGTRGPDPDPPSNVMLLPPLGDSVSLPDPPKATNVEDGDWDAL